MNEPVTEVISRLRPDIVVKGKEHESRFNPELEVLEEYGGRLLFSSGETAFSSLDLLRYELLRSPFSPNPWPKIMEKQALYLEDNTPEEILDTVKEFIEREGSAPTPLQEKANAMLLPSNYSYGAKGHFSNTILEKYFSN